MLKGQRKRGKNKKTLIKILSYNKAGKKRIHLVEESISKKTTT